jgi:glycerophosphoryl diester phosphodiesterase
MIRGAGELRGLCAGRSIVYLGPAVPGAVSKPEVRAGVLPPVIGHRGAAANAPENTLAGLREAAALGCRWVEFDVRLTADHRPVLLHDERLKRTTGGRGKASALSLAAIGPYDAGRWFAPSFAGERIPTLEEAILLVAELGLGANVELKASRGREDETGTVVADFLVRHWRAELPAPIISSFQQNALAAAQARAPGIARGMLFRVVPKNWRTIAERLACTTIHADHLHLAPAVVAEIREAGYPVLAYTVNDSDRAKHLFALGVTSVFSDAPGCLLGALGGRADGQPTITSRYSAATARQG